MADIINFGVERAKRKSGIKNTAYLESIIYIRLLLFLVKVRFSKY